MRTFIFVLGKAKWELYAKEKARAIPKHRLNLDVNRAQEKGKQTVNRIPVKKTT